MSMRSSLPLLLVAGLMMSSLDRPGTSRPIRRSGRPNQREPENWQKKCRASGCNKLRRGNRSYCSIECCENSKIITNEK